MSIQIRQDQQRGCGWRKAGGLYLISGGVSAPCGLLPIPLDKCPTCSCGIKQTRGWTWINFQGLLNGKKCKTSTDDCLMCPMSQPARYMGPKQGLLWIGGKFYAKPEDWTAEAIKQGVSRRLSAIPKDFKLGETWVLVAHGKHSQKPCPDCAPFETLDHRPLAVQDGKTARLITGETIVLDGQPACKTCKNDGVVPQAAIFHAFKPSAIEYVVKGTETPEDIEAMEKRGITCVKIERVDSNGNPIDAPSLPELEEDVTEVEPETAWT